MVSNRPTITIFMLATLLLAVLASSPTTITVSADCEEDLVELQEDLNATQRELALVKEERDDYAQRLQDSTSILILAVFLLVGSYFVFYLSAKRQRLYITEIEKRMGVQIIPKRQPRRRRKK